MKLTVLFDGQYWIGYIEQADESKLKACKYIFGSEPKEQEIFDFVNKLMIYLINNVSESINFKTDKLPDKINPKRLSRQIAKEMKEQGISQYTHEALQAEIKMKKIERKITSKENKLAYKERKKTIAKEKSKLKHRGK